MRTCALLLTAFSLVTLSACGSEKATSADPVTGSPGVVSPSPTTAPATSLTVTLTRSPTSKPITWTLTCDPAGGTLPAAAKACAQLTAGSFAPVAADATCTEIYGGPERGTVTGTFQGKPVDAVFSRKNGCELDRWSKVSELFGELPRVR
ncbi:MAG: SSI family serine proteinase inhibitor [Streptosporangiaceae bacterium]